MPLACKKHPQAKQIEVETRPRRRRYAGMLVPIIMLDNFSYEDIPPASSRFQAVKFEASKMTKSNFHKNGLICSIGRF